MADEKLHPEVEALIESVREKWEGSERLVRIALLAASKAREEERERCAKVCDEYPKRDPAEDGNGYWAAQECAAAIRRKKP